MASELPMYIYICITFKQIHMAKKVLNTERQEATFQRKLISDCKKLKISVQEKAFADLMAVGWKDKDAYLLTGLYNPIYTPLANEKDMNALLLDDKEFKDYYTLALKRVERIGKKDDEETISEDDIANELSKDTQLRELIAAKKKYAEGTKEWLDIKKMIADITQVKKDEIKEEDTTVHYYLPLSCNKCSLYQKEKKKVGR